MYVFFSFADYFSFANSAREVDNKVAAEIQQCLHSGLVTNKQSDLFDRMSRNTQRITTSARKKRAAYQRDELAAGLREQIAAEKSARWESTQRQKALQQQLSVAQPSATQSKASRSVKRVLPPASSSGRVLSMSTVKGKARQVSNPYPMGNIFLTTLFVLAHILCRFRIRQF